nr:hypothetical protein [Planomonospora venezuelensis]
MDSGACHDQDVDSQDSPLHKAVRLCLVGTRTEEATARAAEVMERLKDDDWEAALVLLEDLGDDCPQSPEFWGLLADAARLLWLQQEVGWYEWRRSEARNGALRAELCLLPAGEGGRKVPVLPGEVLRPMWDIGQRTPEGELSVSIAFLWLEGRTPLEPGGCAPVRLLPLASEHWRHLKPGDVIIMHEMRPPVGMARVIEVMPPVAAAP